MTRNEAHEQVSDQIHRVRCLVVALDGLVDDVACSDSTERPPHPWEKKQRNALLNLVTRVGEALAQLQDANDRASRIETPLSGTSGEAA